MISAVSHPLRRQILLAYLDGPLERASARELAEAMGQRVGQVAYHLKALGKSEILRPIRRGDGEDAKRGDYSWALDVEAVWLRLVLEVWVEADRIP